MIRLTSTDSDVSYSYAVTRLPYQTHVVETRGDQTKEVKQSEAGWQMPLYVGVRGK